MDAVRRGVDRQYGVTTVQSPSNHLHVALAMRIPRESIAEISPEDVTNLRAVLAHAKKAIDQCQYAYIVANRDHERLGRRVLLELLGLAPEPAAPAVPQPEPKSESTSQPQPVAPAPAASFAFPRSPAGASAPAPAPVGRPRWAVRSRRSPRRLPRRSSSLRWPLRSPPPRPSRRPPRSFPRTRRSTKL